MSGVLRRSLTTITVAALVLSACGGDDDDAAGVASEQATTTEAARDTGGDGTVQVDSIKDIPKECLDIFGDYLKQIEPVVKDVDWSQADVSTLEDIGSQLGSVGSSMDDDMKAAGCDKYNLSGDVDMDELIDIAKDKAPGTVAYFEFLETLSEGIGGITTAPPTTGDDTGGGDTGGGAAGDLPTDCDGAKAYIEDAMGKYDTMTDMPVSELTTLSQVMGVITAQCPANDHFFTRDDVTQFLG
jgi:hypothetical protein